MGSMRSPTEKATLAILAASCLVLAAVEHLIPKPLPFIRLGLANMPILVAVGSYRFRRILLLAALKIIGQGVLTGTLLSYVFLFSAAGTMASVCTMYLIYHLFGSRISLIGVSVAGAFASNVLQLVLAAFVIFGSGVMLLAPPLLLSGLISSVILGIIVNRFIAESRWYAGVFGGGEVYTDVVFEAQP